MRNTITITRLFVRPQGWMVAGGRGASAAYVVVGVDPIGIRLKEGET